MQEQGQDWILPLPTMMCNKEVPKYLQRTKLISVLVIKTLSGMEISVQHVRN